jgi:glycosyltransferase involved in cell wall biosynthesis
MLIKPLLINSSINEGGSSKAVLRLLRGLRKLGIEAYLACRDRSNGEEGIVGISGLMDRIMSAVFKGFESSLIRLYPRRRRTPFTSAWIGGRVMKRVHSLGINVVHLNQFNHGFLGMSFLRKCMRPLVWTLHDWWGITGGCHFPGDCKRHRSGCGLCPVLGSNAKLDLSRLNFAAKSRIWPKANVRLTSVSSSLRADIQGSRLLKGKPVEVIPNGLDLEVFRPIPKTIARNVLAIPRDTRVLLFGANAFRVDVNKGFATVAELSRHFSGLPGNVRCMILTFGDNTPIGEGELGISNRSLGYVSDEVTLALLYSAADLTLVPSRQESFGLTAAESLACGTPVLCFRTGGLTDIVDHKVNGFLADPFSNGDFIHGAEWLLQELNSPERSQQLRDCAREKALREFDIKRVSQRYFNEYATALQPSPVDDES